MQLNPADAAQAHVEDGAQVRITSPWGELTARARVTEDVSSGAVGLTQGWGHRGGWRTAVAAGGVSYNLLTPTDPAEIDQPSGNAFFNGIPVALAASAEEAPG